MSAVAVCQVAFQGWEDHVQKHCCDSNPDCFNCVNSQVYYSMNDSNLKYLSRIQLEMKEIYFIQVLSMDAVGKFIDLSSLTAKRNNTAC